MAVPIIPRLVRGCLVWFVGDVGFESLKTAIRAWIAAEAHGLDLVDAGGAE